MADSTELLDWPPIRLYVRDYERRFFPVSELVCLEAEANYCWLHWQDGQRLLTSRTLKHYADKIPATWFIRLHRKCIVNKLFMEKIEYSDIGYRVDMVTGQSFPVSRRRWPLVRQQILGDQALNSRQIAAFFDNSSY